MSEKIFQRKLTTATCGIDPRMMEDLTQDTNEEIPVLRLYGKIEKGVPDKSDYGEYVKFYGEFQGVNAIDGKTYRSKALILPEVASMFIEDELSKIKASDDKADLIFGLDITVKKNISKKGGWKFKYGVRPLKSVDVKDTLDLIGEQICKSVPLLPVSNKKSKK